MSHHHEYPDSPYHPVMQVIRRHGYSGGGIRLCRFLLSLFNTEDFPYSAGNLNYLTPEIRADALAALKHYCEHGEDGALLDGAQEIFEMHPWMLDEANALREWRRDRERELEHQRRKFAEQ